MSATPRRRNPDAAFKEQQATNRTRAIALFVVGGLFGSVVGFYCLIQVREPGLFVSGILACAIFVGWLSARFGVRFWEWLAEYGRWLLR